MEEPRTEIKLVEQGSKKNFIFIILGIIILFAVGFFVIQFFIAPEEVPEDEEEEIGRVSLVNTGFDYSVDYPEGWSMKRQTFDENKGLNADAIMQKITTCGFSCAASDIVTFRKEPHSFKIYVFSNPDELPLLDFLAIALLKNEDNLFFFFEDEVAVAREDLDMDDGRRVRNIYFSKPSRKDLVYWSSQDYVVSDDEEFEAILSEVSIILSSFQL